MINIILESLPKKLKNFNILDDGIFQIKSDKSGKNIVIMTCVHGDEIVGIEILEKLTIKLDTIGLNSGIVTIVCANLDALKQNKRYISEDMNRLLAIDSLKNLEKTTDSSERNRLKRILPFITNCDILLDIHSTIKPSEPFIFCQNTDKHIRIAKYFDLEKIITISKDSFNQNDIDLFSSFDSFADRNGGIGITVESGSIENSCAKLTINGIIKVLEAENIINKIPQIEIIGAVSNSIIRDGGIRGMSISLKHGFSDMKKISVDKISVGCGALDSTVAQFAAENNIAGFEFLIGIPGTIGGNIFMNAGCYGSEIVDIFVSCEYVDADGNVGILYKKDINFTYRSANLPHNIILTHAILQGKVGKSEEILQKMIEITQKRKQTQPVGRKTVGSTFKNPKYFSKESWELITQHFQSDFPHKFIQNSQQCNNYLFIYNKIIAISDNFVFIDKDIRNFSFYKSGNVLAKDNNNDITVTQDSFVIFPKNNIKNGDFCCFLAKNVTE